MPLFFRKKYTEDTAKIISPPNKNTGIKLFLIPVLLSSESIASLAAVLIPFPKRSVARAVKIQSGYVKTAIIGGKFSTETTPVLYLQETQNGLSLVGTTAIKGVVFLPSQGVKTGYIAGNSFYGAKLIDGATEKSKTSLPPLSKNVLASLDELFKTNPSEQQETVTVNSVKSSVHSFVNSR